jgi:phosphoenolpyruvate synthase/pyruvate phosphate dikinase
MQGIIEGAVAAADPERSGTLEQAATYIRGLFQEGTLPHELVQAIERAYATLGKDVAVTVRSSATAEDLPELSFAGQQDSYLNVQGTAAVLAAVRRCWASLWTARAIGYRAHHGIAPGNVSMAVVVQELVPAEAAGVLFTADPVTGERDRAVISAAWGLGEAVVGGLVTPDSLTVAKESGAILAEQVADKAAMTVRTADGTHTEATPEGRRRQAVLTAGQAAELTRLGVQIEQLFGQPVDVEWTLLDGAFAIVQARPITALPEATDAA